MLSEKELKKLKENKSLNLGIRKGKTLKEIIKQLDKLNFKISNKYSLNDKEYYKADIYHNTKFFKLFIH